MKPIINSLMAEFYQFYPSPFPEEPKPRDTSAPMQTSYVAPPSEQAKSALESVVQMAEAKGESSESKEELLRPAQRFLISLVFTSIAVIVFAAVLTQYLVTRDTPELPEDIVKIAPVNLITAARGGEISSHGLRIIVPPSALKADAVIAIEKVRSGDVTDLFHITPDGISFLRPVTVVVPYNADKLKPGEKPENIRLESWQAGTLKKKQVPFTVNSKERTLWAQLTEL